MDSDLLHVRARIELLPHGDGGRQVVLSGPVSYLPNHNFFDAANQEMCIGSIDLEEGQELAPGAAMDLDIMLLTLPKLKPEWQVGRRWRLQEGKQLVG